MTQGEKKSPAEILAGLVKNQVSWERDMGRKDSYAERVAVGIAVDFANAMLEQDPSFDKRAFLQSCKPDNY
jgi:hypothetical protein